MKRAFLVFVLFVISCSTAQQPTGSIAGVVTIDGAVLPGATVTLQSKSAPDRSEYTDVEGKYSFLGLPPGRYQVTTSLEGLTTTTQRVTVAPKRTVTVHADLHPASVSEAITVTASGPMFDEDAIDLLPTRREHMQIVTKSEPVTTFSIDVDRASYANVRRYLLEGLVPPPNAVRIEEMLNYFTYSYPQPEGNAPFSVTTEVAGCPWNTESRLLRVGIQGHQLDRSQMAPNNLVFLLDVSGSMDEARKLPLVQHAFRMLVRELRAEDRVAIVVYAGAAGLVLPSTSGADKAAILSAIDNLEAGGSTAGGAGIELAYSMALENFLKDGNNRVILATDGDFNVGVSSMDDLQKLIEAKRDHGVFLSVAGVGDDLEDDLMEMLADKGNGNYSYLDSPREAEKMFVHELTGTLVAIAKDVKVQLEFDPRVVASYRQIGYENRSLDNKDFADDKADAGELGAGHSVTALFEIVPTTAFSQSARLGELRVRYKEPTGRKSQLLTAELIDEGKGAYEASADLQFASAVAAAGMLLRDSPHKGTATWDDVVHLARISQGVDLDGTRAEFTTLAEKAKGLR